MTSEAGRWAIGLDLGGSAVKSGLVAADGSIAVFERTPIDRRAGADHLLAALLNQIERLRAAAAERPCATNSSGTPNCPSISPTT